MLANDGYPSILVHPPATPLEVSAVMPQPSLGSWSGHIHPIARRNEDEGDGGRVSRSDSVGDPCEVFLGCKKSRVWWVLEGKSW